MAPRIVPPLAPLFLPQGPRQAIPRRQRRSGSLRLPICPPRYPGDPGAGFFPEPVFRQLFFGQLVRAAGIIFSGRVTSIGQSVSFSRPDPASTIVTFQVEHAIRGALPGQNLTIHEWAGLCSNGERYRVGERVLLFLYSP